MTDTAWRLVIGYLLLNRLELITIITTSFDRIVVLVFCGGAVGLGLYLVKEWRRKQDANLRAVVNPDAGTFGAGVAGNLRVGCGRRPGRARGCDGSTSAMTRVGPPLHGAVWLSDLEAVSL